MKKLLVIMTALAMVFGVAASAYAVGGVSMTLTSPTIVKKGCEQAGSTTYGFEAGTQIVAGDWWYMDLPGDVTICKSLDFLIAGGNAGTININGGVNATVFTVAADAIGGGAVIPAGVTQGPISTVDLGGGAATVNVGSIVLRVTAAAGSQRVFIQAYGAAAGDSITVGAATVMNIKILDGALHNGFILRDTAGATAGSAKDGIYNNTPPAGTDELAGPVPDVQNTLCINAENTASTLVFVSFSSKNFKFTFSGDSQIAHVGSAISLALAGCKGDLTGNILIGGQNACNFTYETAAGYCPVPPGTFTGNRLLVQGSSVFGDPGDRYDMTITSDTAGVYFSAVAAVWGYTPSATNQCTAFGTAVATGFMPTSPAGTGLANGVTWPGLTCSVDSASRVNKLSTLAGAITGINTYDRLWVQLPAMYYDTSIVGNGTEVDITITMGKYPCGTFFSETRTIGTFVTTCPVGAGGTALMYPFFPPMDGSIAGWWGGFTVNNAGTGSGTATLTFWEMDGDTATLTTPSIAAGGMWVGGFANILANATPGAANTGTFGDSNVMVTVTCNFNLGGGFAFLGNGNEGTGYTAYVLGAAGWQ